MRKSTAPGRNLLRFSMRVQLLLILVLAIPLGWFAFELRNARHQQEARRHVTKLGGYTYLFDRPEWASGTVAGAQSSVPSWLRKALGDDFFFNVIFVELTNPFDEVFTDETISDDDFVAVSAFADLEYLDAKYLNIDGSGLVHIASLAKLTGVNLSQTTVTDENLVHVSQLVNLEVLYLDGCQGVTDAGVTHLQQLSTLKTLSVLNTNISQRGYDTLKNALPECEIAYAPASQTRKRGWFDFLKGSFGSDG